MSTQCWELCELTDIAMVIILDDGNIIFLQECKCLIRHDTSVGTVILDQSVEIYCDFFILDQMLEIWVSTVFSNNCFVLEIFLELFEQIFIELFDDVHPGFCDQNCKSIPFTLVKLGILHLFYHDRNIFGGDYPLLCRAIK